MTELPVQGADAPFAPNWVSPPGDTILDLLEERAWTQQQLADRLGYTPKHVNQLIKAKVPLTEDAAIRLQNVLGASVGFWLTREAQYRERVAVLEAAERQVPMVPWLERFPRQGNDGHWCSCQTAIGCQVQTWAGWRAAGLFWCCYA